MKVNQVNSQKLGLSKRPASSYSEIHAHQIHSSSQSLTSFTDLSHFQQNSQPNQKQFDHPIKAQHIYSPSLSTKGAKSERIGSLPSSNLTTPTEKYHIQFASNGTPSQKQLFEEQQGKTPFISDEKCKKDQQLNGNADTSSFRLDLALFSRANLQQNEHHHQMLSPEVIPNKPSCLKHDIAQVSESNKVSSWDYQNAILENELYRSRKQTIYTEKQPEHLKREIMNRIEKRHRDELHNLQEAWEKEKVILSRTVKLQKLRLLDNERIMLQMEGDLEQVKSLANSNINSVEDNINKINESRSRNGQQITQNITKSIEKNDFTTEQIASPVRNQKQFSSDKSSPLISSFSEKKLPSTFQFFHKRNVSTAVSTPNPLHHKQLGSNPQDASSTIIQSASTAKHANTSAQQSLSDQVDNQKLLSPVNITPPSQTKQLVKEIFFQNQKIFGSKTPKSQANSSLKQQANNLSIQSPQNFQKKYSKPDLSSPKQVNQVQINCQADSKAITSNKQDQAADKVLRAHRSSKSINNDNMNQIKQKDKRDNKQIQSKP